MPWEFLLKVQERFLIIFIFYSFYGGLNKNELLSECWAYAEDYVVHAQHTLKNVKLTLSIC